MQHSALFYYIYLCFSLELKEDRIKHYLLCCLLKNLYLLFFISNYNISYKMQNIILFSYTYKTNLFLFLRYTHTHIFHIFVIIHISFLYVCLYFIKINCKIQKTPKKPKIIYRFRYSSDVINLKEF